MTFIYNLNDINKIINEGFFYKLPKETINIIEELCNNMNIDFKPNKSFDFSIPNNIEIIGQKNKQRNNNNNYNNNYNNKHSSYLNEDWGFKSTDIPKKNGIEQKINEIRICLNKITPKNIETQYTILINNICLIFDLYDLESDEIKKVVNIILEICSTNKYYYEIYSDIYSRIILQYPLFNDYLQNFFYMNYLPSFNKINYIDCNKDYDGFCAYNKENDIRKANTMFFIQMMNKDILKKQEIIKCIQQLLITIFDFISKDGFINEVEEITENIYIFIKYTTEKLSTEIEWEDIIENIEKLSTLKHNSYPSLSNRAIFKYMDIID